VFRRSWLKVFSFWTIPVAYAFIALMLGWTLPRLEIHYFGGLGFPIHVDSARAIFSSVSSGMIALTGIVFSLAFVMTQFSASSYSPRLVMWIAQDPVLQHAMGIFTATFLYTLLALAWVERDKIDVKVPFVSVAMTMILLMASVLIFLRLMQRLSLLQVNQVLRTTGDRGREVIDNMQPLSAMETDAIGVDIPHGLPVTQILIHSGRPRVIQAVRVPVLVSRASKTGAVIEMVAGVGDTLVEGTPLLRVHGAVKPISERSLKRAIQTGEERTFEQDPKYAIRLLVDIAIRALSPAVNDPTTAVQALDEIEDLLRRLGTRRLNTGAVRDGKGALRVVMTLPTWDDLMMLAFDEIRYYGATSVQVMRRMKALGNDLIAGLPEIRHAAIRHYLTRIDATISRSFADLEEQKDAAVQDRQGLGVPRRG
jgi:uncharacterized membrane protein